MSVLFSELTRISFPGQKGNPFSLGNIKMNQYGQKQTIKNENTLPTQSGVETDTPL